MKLRGLTSPWAVCGVLLLATLLNYMDRNGYRQCTPRRTDPTVAERPWVDFSSGYIQRTLERFPKQGSKTPWRLYQNYALDVLALRLGRVDDGTMEFSNRPQEMTELERLAG